MTVSAVLTDAQGDIGMIESAPFLKDERTPYRDPTPEEAIRNFEKPEWAKVRLNRFARNARSENRGERARERRGI